MKCCCVGVPLPPASPSPARRSSLGGCEWEWGDGVGWGGGAVRSWQGALMYPVLEEACSILANEFGKQQGLRTAPDCEGADAVFPAKVTEGLSERL